MATLHYFWMKFDCHPSSVPQEAVTASQKSAPGGNETLGGTVRSRGGSGGGSGPQSTGSDIQGGTVRSGGGSGGGSGPQAVGPTAKMIPTGATVRSRAQTTIAAGDVSFNLLDSDAQNKVGAGSVSFYSLPDQTAIRFANVPAAHAEKSKAEWARWRGNAVAVLTAIETP